MNTKVLEKIKQALVGIICQDLINRNSELETENKKLKEDVTYFETRVQSLTIILANAVEFPDISPFIEERKIITPYALAKPKYMGGEYDILCADANYYALTKENWVKVLTPIQMQVVKLLREWRKDISDCDDFSLLMASFVMSCFAGTSLDLQGAFCMLWSNSHAYNGFISNDDVFYIYEPQGGNIVGELGKTIKPYDTMYIWFMS